MKLIIMIWTFFILGLGCIPCADGLSPCHNSTHSEQHQDTSHSKDGCTPFCSCMCFGAVVVSEAIQASGIIKILHIIVKNDSYQPLYSEAYLNIVWQPPTFC